MNQPDSHSCRWCGEPITAPRQGQKFCRDQHRYLWHKAQRISPAQLDSRIDARIDARIREIVKDEINKALANR